MKPCLVCGHPCPSFPTRKFCSRACAKKNRKAQDRERKRKLNTEKLCAICAQELPPNKSKFCSRECFLKSRNIPGQSTKDARRKRLFQAHVTLLSARLVSPEEVDRWVAEAEQISWAIRLPQSTHDAQCLRCAKPIPRAPRFQRRSIFCSRLCYHAHRKDALRLDSTGAAHAHYYGQEEEQRPEEDVDPAKNCRGLLDQGEPCAANRKIRMTSPLGLCPVCASETFSGRADELEAANAPVATVRDARRLSAAFIPAMPSRVPAVDRRERGPARFPSVELLHDESNALEFLSGVRFPIRVDSGDYWATFRDRVLLECRELARVASGAVSLDVVSRAGEILLPLYAEANALRGHSHPGAEAMDKLRAMRFRAIRALATMRPGSPAVESLPVAEEWLMDWARRNRREALLIPMRPQRSECAFCGVPALHRPLAPWSNFCPDHVNSPEALLHVLPLREKERREMEAQRREKANRRAEEKAARRELQAREIDEREAAAEQRLSALEPGGDWLAEAMEKFKPFAG